MSEIRWYTHGMSVIPVVVESEFERGGTRFCMVREMRRVRASGELVVRYDRSPAIECRAANVHKNELVAQADLVSRLYGSEKRLARKIRREEKKLAALKAKQ